MSAPFPPPDRAEPVDDDAWERALLERQLARLDRLADMGMEIAGAIHREATADEGAAGDLPHAALDFSRVARAVRMTLALQSRLIADFKDRSRRAAAANDDDDAVDDDPEPEPGLGRFCRRRPALAAEAHRRRAQAIVRGLAEGAGLEAETAERLAGEARERLEGDDIWPVLAAHSLEEIVAMICRDLGLAADPADIAVQAAALAEREGPLPRLQPSLSGGWILEPATVAPDRSRSESG